MAVWTLGFLCPLAPAFAQPQEARKAAVERADPDSEERRMLVRVQILLDLTLFRPGKIDGLGGDFTQKAADRFLGASNLPRGTRFDLERIGEPYKAYTVTDADMKWIGRTALTPGAQAKLSSMPYATVHELVAEKFHCELEFLRELNPELTNPGVGTVFRVPNVPEFSMDAVRRLDERRKHKDAEAKAVEAAALEVANTGALQSDPFPGSPIPPSESVLPSPTPAPAPSPAPTAARTRNAMVVINRADRMLDLYEDGLLVASFPCTPGSRSIPVPRGEWKITSNILFPYFRYDKSVLRSGVRSADAHNIPPGPNNYVGIVWMGINRRSIGIHGTNTPDAIGRNESSGCIRLANWDAWELCRRIDKNTPVIVQ